MADKLGAQLLVGQVWDVSVGEPDSITSIEHGHLTVVEIRLLLLAMDGALKPHVSIIPNFLYKPEPFVHLRGIGLARSPLSQGWLIYPWHMEESQPGGGVFRPGKESGPLPLLVLAVSSQDPPLSTEEGSGSRHDTLANQRTVH